MSKIKIIAHPETGNLFTETSKEGWVKCQLQSEELVVSNGVITKQKRVAFPLISADAASMMNSLKSGSVFPIEGKIIRKITSEPQYEGHKAVVNPSTGEEKNYYQTFEFTTNTSAVDVDERVVEAVSVTEKTPANAEVDNEV